MTGHFLRALQTHLLQGLDQHRVTTSIARKPPLRTETPSQTNFGELVIKYLMTFTTDELALRTLLERTAITPEAAVRVVRNAGLSPARSARLLHGVLELPVNELKVTIRKVFDEFEAQLRADATQEQAELEALFLEEANSQSTWTAMTFTNFGLNSLIEVTQDGNDYDLHNNALFQGLQYDATKSRLRLEWVIVEFGAEQAELHILFEGVDHFTIHARDPTLPLTEDMTLAHIEFLSFGASQQTKYFQNLSFKAGEHVEDSALLFQFDGGQAFVVHAMTASMIIKRRK